MSLKTLRIWTVVGVVLLAVCLAMLVCVYAGRDREPIDAALQFSMWVGTVGVCLNFVNLYLALRRKRKEEKRQ